ncbi:MAG: hypothetical protein P1U74_03225 [Legionellaceae bacterium]|nr:hypothetical protein [Legionellaceae bacterium]
MQKKIDAHLLFMYGHHVEILLEIPNNVVIYIDEYASEIQETGYVWNGRDLYLYDEDGARKHIEVLDKNILEQGASGNLLTEGVRSYFYLTKSQLGLNDEHNNSLAEHTSQYFCLNRWKDPCQGWEFDHAITYSDETKKNKRAYRYQSLKNRSESTYTFTLEADPMEIVLAWNQYHEQTKDDAFIFGDNCAVASQWFLEKYANIPHPKCWSAPFGINQLMYYLHTPSFIPAFALIPKRVFDNAKFHLEARKTVNPKESHLRISMRIAINFLLTIGGISGIIYASKHMSKAVSSILAPSLGLLSIYRSTFIFSDLNKIAAQNIADSHDEKANISAEAAISI